jgi:NADP-dependent 3-hydroxy acid dehydrogenase YdfG
MKLENKVVVITGASQGLGEAIACKAAKEGAKIALVARTEKLLEKVKKAIEKDGGEAEYFVCDITKIENIKSVVDKIVERFGKIDISVNNAGIWTDDEIEKNNPEQAKIALDTNVLGNIWMTKETLPMMKKQNKGHIFNIISTSGLADWDNTNWQTYGATKWAMTGFTKSLKDSLKGTKIKVTGFFPGGMDTNIFENAGKENCHNLPWMMKKEDVADIVIFALTRPDDILMESIVVTKTE